MWEQVLDEWERVLADLERDPLSDGGPTRLDGEAAHLRGLPAIATASPGTPPSSDCSTCSITTSILVAACTSDSSIAAPCGDSSPTQRSRWPSSSHLSDTRAFFRGSCVERYPDGLVAANWDSMVFDVGEETLKRVPMMEPLHGTSRQWAICSTPRRTRQRLVRALGGNDG